MAQKKATIELTTVELAVLDQAVGEAQYKHKLTYHKDSDPLNRVANKVAAAVASLKPKDKTDDEPAE